MATPIARVVAQQCFSASLFSLRFHSRQENLGARYKKCYSIFLSPFTKTGNARIKYHTEALLSNDFCRGKSSKN
jgi:hypothetical protein